MGCSRRGHPMLSLSTCPAQGRRHPEEPRIKTPRAAGTRSLLHLKNQTPRFGIISIFHDRPVSDALHGFVDHVERDEEPFAGLTW